MNVEPQRHAGHHDGADKANQGDQETGIKPDGGHQTGANRGPNRAGHDSHAHDKEQVGQHGEYEAHDEPDHETGCGDQKTSAQDQRDGLGAQRYIASDEISTVVYLAQSLCKPILTGLVLGGEVEDYKLEFDGVATREVNLSVSAGAGTEAAPSVITVTATALAAAGASMPADKPLDGVDLLPYLLGAKSEAPRLYDVGGIPTFLLLDAKGRIVKEWTGYTPYLPGQWRAEVNQLLAEGS